MPFTDNQFHERDVFAEMNITQRDTGSQNPYVMSLTGTGTDVLNPPTGYQKISEYVGTTRGGFTYDETTGEMIIPHDGWYYAVGWLNFRHSHNNATIGLVFGFRQNDTDTFTYSNRPTSSKKPNTEDIGGDSGGGRFYATKGTRISVHISTNISGDITIPNSTLLINCNRIGSQNF